MHESSRKSIVLITNASWIWTCGFFFYPLSATNASLNSFFSGFPTATPFSSGRSQHFFHRDAPHTHTSSLLKKLRLLQWMCGRPRRGKIKPEREKKPDFCSVSTVLPLGVLRKEEPQIKVLGPLQLAEENRTDTLVHVPANNCVIPRMCVMHERQSACVHEMYCCLSAGRVSQSKTTPEK